MAHLSETFSRKGVLSRDGKYRATARKRLEGLGIYDDVAQIKKGLQQFAKAKNHKTLVNGLTIDERVPLYAFDYSANGSTNYEVGRKPYRNQAHHVVPTEVFYDDKWTAKHLRVVLQSKYNINNTDNIIYLPQCEGETWMCHINKLPDHSRRHNKYNERVVGEVDAVFDMVEEALEEKDCEKRKDLRNDILNELETIQTNNHDYITARGTKALG